MFQKTFLDGVRIRSSHARKTVGLRLEELETRLAPASFSFDPSAMVAASTNLNGIHRSGQGYWMNASEAQQTLASSPGSQWEYGVNASVSYSHNEDQSTTGALHTAISSGPGDNAGAIINTSQSRTGSASAWVTVHVTPGYGEGVGQSVTVMVNASYTRFVAVSGGSDYVLAGVYAAGSNQTLLKGANSGPMETPYRSRSFVFSTTIGSTFQIFLYLHSSAAGECGAQSNLSLTMKATGGQSTSQTPTAPGQPSWSSAGGSDIYLSWNSTGASSYSVWYWNPHANQWSRLTTTPGNSTETKISYGRGYYWIVGANYSNGTTLFSPYVLAN